MSKVEKAKEQFIDIPDGLEVRIQEYAKELAEAHSVLHVQAGLLNLVQDAILVRDLEDRVTYWNQGAEKTYGWTRDEARGRLSHELLQTEFRVPADRIRELLTTTGVWEGELRHLRRDGWPILVESRWFLQCDSDGGPAGIVQIDRDISKRKTAEEALKHSEKSLAEAQRIAHLGSWEWDIESGRNEWSDEQFRIFGYEPQELAPSYDFFMKAIYPEDRKKILTALRNALNRLDHYDVEGRILLPDGRIRFIRCRGDVYCNAQAQPVRMLGTVQDVTEQREAEEALRESERRFRLIAETIHDAFWLFKPGSAETVYVSPGYERIWGRPSNAVDGSALSFIKTVHPDDRERVLEAIDKATRGIGTEQEYRIIRPDGSIRWIADRGFPVTDEQGNVDFMVGIATDITDRKLAEEESARAGAMLQKVFDGISDPLLLLAPDLTVKMFNKASGKYFQITKPKEALARTCYELAGERSAPCDGCLIAPAVLMGESVTCERKGLFDPDRVEQVTVYPVYEAAGEISGAIVRICDVTEAKKMEYHLMHADRMASLGQLSGGIAHEIRNPLAGMNLFVDLLSNQEKFDRSERELTILGEIKDNIKKIDAIIKRVLQFSRQATHSTRSSLDVGQLIEDALEFWHSGMRKHEIEVRISVEEHLPGILGDAIEIGQVLNNLIQNAMEAMREGGLLSINARRGVLSLDKERPAVTIEIRDSGIGIPPDQQKHIFNPFFTTKYAGTGLGLSISQRIINRHGGIMSFKSKPKEGTTFLIELPVATGA